MAFNAKITNAKVLKTTDRGNMLNLFIAWSERRRDEWIEETAGVTVFKPEDAPKLGVRDTIDIDNVKLQINESDDWKRVKLGETATQESPSSTFYNFSTFGDQITVTKKGDPTTTKKEPVSGQGIDQELDDKLPF